ncbi:MAG: hypothetical protein F9K18_13445 [Thermoanaerobaculia bacterium]|nr:MAG: hypothetical protein F9K18_13445 [Thermoanaerobaculia bacterium]
MRALIGDAAFWEKPEDGLALFVAPSFFRAVRLPYSVRERVTAGARFPLRPLLPLADRDRRFYVLALAEHDVRLIEVEGGVNRRLSAPGLPVRIEKLLGFTREPSLQTHPSGRRSAVHHGGGEESERHKSDLRRFAAAVAAHAAAAIEDPRAPVVLAAVESLHRTVAEHWPDERLIAEAIAGSPDGVGDEELAARARAVVARAREACRLDRARHWSELATSGRVTDEPQSVLLAAEQGRVERLFLVEDAELWGSFDSLLGHLDAHPEARRGDEDLLERATISTLGFGGEVESVPHEALDSASPFAAVLRY